MDCFSCPVCGQCTAGDNNHKCHPRTVATVENRERRAYLEQERPHRPTYGERLERGFGMLQQLEIW
jgi:hypothetical protein